MILACNNITRIFGTNEVLSGCLFILINMKKQPLQVSMVQVNLLLLKFKDYHEPDEGEVILEKGATTGYLAQHHDLDSTHTIYEEMLEVKHSL